MLKIAKTKLLAELEIDTNSITALLNYSNSSAYIIDFMATLQTAKKGKLATFNGLSEALSEQVLSAFKFGNIVSVVPDLYNIELSISLMNAKGALRLMFQREKLSVEKPSFHQTCKCF